MYEVEFTTSAARQLAEVRPPDRDRIVHRIEGLATDPRPPGVEKLKGQADAYRVRQGNFRIIYTVEDSIQIVTITRIGHRREVYR